MTPRDWFGVAVRVLGIRFWLLVVATSGFAVSRVDAAEPTADELRRRAREVLAVVDGTLQVPGLAAPVEVARDRWGVPHIYAQNQRDLFLAQGFVAAQDRLFQLELWRRTGRGENAELYGAEAIDGDRFARLMLYRGDWEAEWRSYSPDAREIVTAFVDGINAQIDACGDRLPIEFQLLGFKPKRWVPEDVLTRMSGLVMCGNWQREIARARLIGAVGIDQARRIAPTDPRRDFALDPQIDPAWITPDLAKGYVLASRAAAFKPPASESNNWVVDGDWSASGKPLLAGDPHRTIALPSLRYLVHLHAPGWNVIGSGEPALPGVAIGHNERIAWAFTIVGTDQADLYVEETHPDDPRQYRVGDEWQAMRTVEETISVRGRPDPEKVELRFTRHGPVIHQDEANRRAFVLRWAGLEPGGAAYLGSLAVDRAQNRDEFLRALQAWKVPGLNFMYADVDGNVGWIAAALTPIRRGWDGLLPVPGASDRYRWDGFLKVADYPQRFNPPEHWLATANHNILPPNYPHEISYEFETPFRYERIRSQLSVPPAATGKFTIADFQRIQQDATSLAAQQLVAMLKTVELPTELRDVGRLLTNWDGTLSVDSAAAPLYAHWVRELDEAFYANRLPQDPRLERGALRRLSFLLDRLSAPDEAWFGAEPRAARDRLASDALAKALVRARQRLGDDRTQWRWGAVHTSTQRHPLAALGPAYAEAFNLPAVPRPGDSTTPNNTRYNEQLEQIHGASYRQVFDLADWDRGVVTSTPGQSGQPESPHYGDLLSGWSRGEYFPLRYSRAKVDEVTAHRQSLLPRK